MSMGRPHFLSPPSPLSATPRSARTRHLVFLGDLIDRGPASVETVNLAIDGKSQVGADQLHILPGNHDLMLLDALGAKENLDHWLMNGGKSVLSELGLPYPDTPSSKIAAQIRGALDPIYFGEVENGPTHLMLGDLLFVHAGVHPNANRARFLTQDRHCVRVDDHWATIRYPFLDWTGGWDADDPDQGRRSKKPTVIIHGHTPALRQNLTSADDLMVCDGIDDYRTVDLDIGAGHRDQLAWAHFRMADGQGRMQIHAVADASEICP